jgi:integrase
LSVAAKWMAQQIRRFERGEVSKGWLDRISRTAEAFSGLNMRCQEFTPLWCDEWSGGKSANYARTELSTIRQILTWAVNNKLLGSHPMAGYKMPAIQSRNRILTYQEHCKLCRAADRKFKPILRFAWMVGCRPGELCSLRWDQIDEDFGRAVMIEHKTAAKVGKPRVIYFPPRAQVYLRKLERDSKKIVRSRKTKEIIHRSQFVFINHRRKPWTKNAIVCRMRAIRKSTSLDVVAYNYRHTWITRALISGVDIATVAELSGHASVAMISRVYGHLDQKQQHLKNSASKIN